MKKQLIAFLTLLYVAVSGLQAQVLLTDYFNYPSGSSIEGQGNWTVSTKSSTVSSSSPEDSGVSPLVATQSLVYSGYDGSETDKVMRLDNSQQNVQTGSRNTVVPFVTSDLATGDVVYTAFLANYDGMGPTSVKEVFSYFKQGASVNSSTTSRGRVQIRIADGKQSFGIRKNDQTITQWSAETNVGTTVLLVVKYVNRSTSSSGDNDEFYLYVNPDPSKSEAENSSCMLTADGNNVGGGANLKHLSFRQTKLTASYAGLRVAKTWSEAVLFRAKPDPVDYPVGTLVANGNTPGTYELIEQQGFGLEPPDESGTHKSNPFQHIQQQWDALLGKYVFSFYIHAQIDDDRGKTTVTDRQRNEIKTGPHSPATLYAQEGETLVMKWKFKLPDGLVTTNKFSHIHQLKGMDNDEGTAEVSLPVITLTCYTTSSGRKVLRLLHNDRTNPSATSAAVLEEVSQNDFLGQWVEAEERVKFGAHGTYDIIIKRVSDGKELLAFNRNDIDMWSTGTSGMRPKWGIYRSVGEDGAYRSILRDEVFLFADFSVEKQEPQPEPVGPGKEWTVKTAKEFADLMKATDKVAPGDTVVLEDGTYNGVNWLTVGCNGTQERPILVKARNPLGAKMTGTMVVTLKQKQYITFQGLDISVSDNSAIFKLEGCNHIRVTRCNITMSKDSEAQTSKWITIGDIYDNTECVSHHNRFDHNLFYNKQDGGSLLIIDGSHGGTPQISQYDRIDHNIFRNVGPRHANEKETIRLGVSDLTPRSAYTRVEYNLFDNCDGDPEVVSVKSCNNTVRYNTFYQCLGTVCLRQGVGSLVEGNYFLGDGKTAEFDGGTIGCGGVRVYGKDHVIINNYMQGLTGSRWDAAITITNGDDTNTSSNNSSHHLPENVLVAHNTLVDCASDMEIGFDNNGKYGKAPKNCRIEHNIIYNPGHTLIKSYSSTSLAGVTFYNNIAYYGTTGSMGITTTADKLKNVDPQLVLSNRRFADASCDVVLPTALYKLSATSPAIEAATGSSVKLDMEGQDVVGSLRDIGADEYNGVDPVVASILTELLVGPAGQEIIEFETEASPTSIDAVQTSRPMAADGVYTLSGQRVSQPRHPGIYIRQGKKHIIY